MKKKKKTRILTIITVKPNRTAITISQRSSTPFVTKQCPLFYITRVPLRFASCLYKERYHLFTIAPFTVRHLATVPIESPGILLELVK